jgi:hypothetical protein
VAPAQQGFLLQAAMSGKRAAAHAE